MFGPAVQEIEIPTASYIDSQILVESVEDAVMVEYS